MKLLSKHHQDSGNLVQVSRGEIAIWSVVSFLAGYTGPFGTYSLGLDRRLAYWTLVVVISAIMAHVFARLSSRMVGPGRPLLKDLILVALMTACFTPVLIGLSRAFLSVELATIADALYFGQFVAIISLCVATTRRLVPRMIAGRSPSKAANAPAPSAPEPRLLKRLPGDVPGPVVRLSSRDHFVDVVTPAAEHRLRMRLADAIDEMDPVEGYCTHRSHWVAREAVQGAERDGGRLLLRLSNGDRVPVSRTYRPRLEEAGLL